MDSSQIDAGASARTRIAARLLPFLFLLYVANYLDRTNIAYATLGMKGDLGLTDSVFGTASGIFFIGYFALQIPGALLVERWSARLLLAITLITWGALTTLTGFVRTPLELYGARFLLGAAEAGFFPGVIVYLSHWFIYQDRAKAAGAVYGRDSNWIYDRRTYCRRDSRCALVRHHRMAMAFSPGRCACHCAGNRGAVRVAGLA